MDEESFNSMIVRLKVPIDINKLALDIMFQFYDSPIKSIDVWNQNTLFPEFQFYDSPIKSFEKKSNLRRLLRVSIL